MYFSFCYDISYSSKIGSRKKCLNKCFECKQVKGMKSSANKKMEKCEKIYFVSQIKKQNI